MSGRDITIPGFGQWDRGKECNRIGALALEEKRSNLRTQKAAESGYATKSTSKS